MQIVDMRLAVSDHADPVALLRQIAMAHNNVYGGALLMRNGSHFPAVDSTSLTVLVDDGFEQGQSIRERIATP